MPTYIFQKCESYPCVIYLMICVSYSGMKYLMHHIKDQGTGKKKMVQLVKFLFSKHEVEHPSIKAQPFTYNPKLGDRDRSVSGAGQPGNLAELVSKVESDWEVI